MVRGRGPRKSRAKFRELPIMTLEERATIFLNVDLDLGGQCDLEELLRHFQPYVFVLNTTGQFLSVELNESFSSVDETIVGWIEVVKLLPPEAKNIWDQCEFRRMNIGIQGGVEPHETHFTISSKTITLLASIQSEIWFSVYAPSANSGFVRFGNAASARSSRGA